MKNKITDLNIKKVVSKDKNFKEYKITYKYNGKPISDYRVFDKDYPDQELKDLVTKQINKDLESGQLVKYARKFTGFTSILVALICAFMVVGIGVGVGTYFAINGNGGATPVVYHTIKFSDNSLNCKMYDVVEPYGEVTSKEWEAGEIARYKIKGNNGYGFPSEDKVTFTTDDGQAFDGLHSYDASTGELSVKMTANVTITAKTTDYHWYLDNDYLNNLTLEDVTKEGGEVQTLKVNGLDHKVRLIGVDEDYGKIGDESTKIHTTWEFVNLLSDANGNSLATQWNDTDDIDSDTGSANHNYLDSSLRMALVGEKQDKGHILWAQKEETTWSTDPLYQNKSVLDMLKEGNPGLVDALKTPSKYINIWNDEKQPDAGWEEKTVEDKLFLLSPKEMGASDVVDEEHNKTYSYYKFTENYVRVKKQVNNEEIYDTYPTISYDSDSGQTYEGDVDNNAGYNAGVEATDGGYYWPRSPDTNFNHYAFYVSPWGQPTSYGGYVYDNAYAVAPAFCI